MPTLLLILAHFLGDFVFQPNQLIKRKYASWRGTFEHVIIITALSLMLLVPFWFHAQTWLVVGIIFALHFLQDVFKVHVDKNYNKEHRTWPYFLDQIFHLALLILLGSTLNDLNPQFELPAGFNELVIAAILLVMVSFTWEITRHQFRRHKKPKLELKMRPFHMLERALFFAILIVTYFLVA